MFSFLKDNQGYKTAHPLDFQFDSALKCNLGELHLAVPQLAPYASWKGKQSKFISFSPCLTALSFAGLLCFISAVFSVFSLPAYVLSSLLFYFSLLNLSLISHQASFSSLTFWCCCFSPSTISLTYGWRPKVHQIKWQKHQKCPSQPEVTRAACCHIVVIGSKRIQVVWIYEWY